MLEILDLLEFQLMPIETREVDSSVLFCISFNIFLHLLIGGQTRDLDAEPSVCKTVALPG